MAMVAELRLGEEAQLKSKISAGALRSILKNEPSPARTLEERRAYLGVIWITSVSVLSIISSNVMLIQFQYQHLLHKHGHAQV